MRSLLIVVALGGVAHAEWKVTEVSGDLAFVDVGEAELHPGMRVDLGAAKGLRVVEVTAKTAAIALDGKPVAPGTVGVAEAPPAKLALTDYTGQWPELAPPARGATPEQIALTATDDERVHLAIIAHALGTVGQGNKRGEAELRVLGSFELMRERPLGADLDVAARAYARGYQNGREPLLVHAATLRYGDPASPTIAVGRLHYAATTLGMLDGGRAALHVGEIEIAAFGGLVPDPINGKPDTTASRFGGEFVYDGASSVYRPRLSVVAHGSTWDGKLDERRLNITSSAVVDNTWLDAWVETQQFPSGNPFGAKAFEVVGAGASGEWRRRDAHFGVDVTYLVPERSLRIAALIPEWLCTRVAGSGPPETCTGDDRLLATTTSAGVRSDHWSLDGAGSLAESRGLARSLGGSGYLRGEYRSGIAGVHLTGSGGRAGFADWISGEVGGSLAPSRRFDMQLAYRPELLTEQVMTSGVVVHSIVADARFGLARSLDLGVFLLTSFGGGRDVLAALTTLAWRPI